MARHGPGRHLFPNEVDRVCRLLRETNLSIRAISVRMKCSSTTIHDINIKFGIRQYLHSHDRNKWLVDGQEHELDFY